MNPLADSIVNPSTPARVRTASTGFHGSSPRLSIRRALTAGAFASSVFASWVAGSGTIAGLRAEPAEAESHWAFRAPVRPPIPATRAGERVRSPIDAFVLDRLAREGLEPAPEADAVTLLRRLSLDLIGLPPSIEELDAYLAGDPEEAWQRAIDRLLRSPHFGERQARLWLDAARYADSDGYEKDKSRSVWFYRDWVIDAFNRKLPYDRFIIDQIAGDLVAMEERDRAVSDRAEPGPAVNDAAFPDRTFQERLVATGFLRNSMINEEGGVDPEQFRMEAMFDRMDAIGKSILGLTIQCAQCHDHKFDPVTQEEYYRIFAFLNDSHEGSVTVYTPEDDRKRASIHREIAEIEARLRQELPDREARLAKWEAERRAHADSWTVIRPEVDELSTGGQKYLPLEDGSFLAQSYAPTQHTAIFTVKLGDEPITGVRLELFRDANLPHGGPGRSILGTAALTEIEIEVASANEPSSWKRAEIARASADCSPPIVPLPAIYDDRSGKARTTGPVEFAIDGKNETAWTSDIGPGRRNADRKAVFALKQPISNPGGTLLRIRLRQNHGGWNSDDNQSYNLGRFRLAVTSAADPSADPLPRRVRELLEVPRGERSPRDDALIFATFRVDVPEWSAANERIESLWREHPEGHSQLVLVARDAPRVTSILRRGDFLSPKERVGPGVPSFLHPLSASGAPTRLDFAKWLVDRRSPTTARAIVNRIWQSYFGTGLVASSEDLGVQCDAPSHPELLDWLAVELMEQDWQLEVIHRAIVDSSTYRQSSRVDRRLFGIDPQNRLLARGARLRVDGELVRDISLAASGLLESTIGGPSVFPPLPEFMLLPPVSYGPKVWTEDKGANRYRRALYTFRFRSVPYPVLQTFDVPNGDFSCVRRARSNTPLQALMALNETVFVECARALAQRTLESAESDDAGRIERAFRWCVARHPTSAESSELLLLLADARSRFRSDESSALLFAGLPTGTAAPIAASEIASWTLVARVLLNLDETITKE
jgi:hypothetical protein